MCPAARTPGGGLEAPLRGSERPARAARDARAHARARARTRARAHARTRARAHARMRACAHARMRACARARVRACARARVRACARVRARARARRARRARAARTPGGGLPAPLRGSERPGTFFSQLVVYKARDGRRVRTPPVLSGSDRTSHRSVGTDPSNFCALGSMPSALLPMSPSLFDAVAQK